MEKKKIMLVNVNISDHTDLSEKSSKKDKKQANANTSYKRTSLKFYNQQMKVCVLLLFVIFIFFCLFHINKTTTAKYYSPELNYPDRLIYTKANHVEQSTQRQVCYYTIPHNGTRYGPVIYQLQPEQIPPSLCTHVIIAAAGIEGDSIYIQNDYHLQIIKRVVKLKEQNQNLKVLLCLATGFPKLVRNVSAISIFAFNAQQFLLKYELDGLDLDWEFPAWPHPERPSYERHLFSLLLIQLNNALRLASHPPHLLSIAVGATKPIIDSSYEVPILAKNVDFVSLMSYDYHMYQTYFPFTGHNAPLKKSEGEDGYFSTLNTQWSTEYWIQMGMPPEKIVIGVPIYGRTWKLLSSQWHTLASPSLSEGFLSGFITYPESLAFIKFGGKFVFDEEALVPYIHKDDDWISFDNAQSIALKASWIKQRNVSGIMTFCLNLDDWHGSISNRRFNLHNVIKDIIHS